MVNALPERGPNASAPAKMESSKVLQPVRIDLTNILNEVNSIIISENSAAKPGEQWSGSGAMQTTGGQQVAGAKQMSPRDQAIAAIPTPPLMQAQLEKHIRTEVEKLHKEARRIALSKPGAAHHLNELYARIHKLNKLLSDLFEASVEVLKRVFIRVFIDRQPIL